MSYTKAAPGAELEALRQRLSTLPPPQLFIALEPLIGTPQLVAAGLTIGDRRTYPEKFSDRDREICRRKQGGESYGELAIDYGLSRTRIAQIVYQGREKSVQDLEGCTAKAS